MFRRFLNWVLGREGPAPVTPPPPIRPEVIPPPTHRPPAGPLPQSAPSTEATATQQEPSSREFPNIEGLPGRIVAIDCETTGLHSTDRIVSFAAISWNVKGLREGHWDFRYLHILVDPGKKSHPAAERVHGYDDWVLRHQDQFSEHAQQISEFLQEADLIVAHNMDFDWAFVTREFASCGLLAPDRPKYCTMQNFRQKYPGLRSSLTAVGEILGQRRVGDRHGALEDAWIALAVYIDLNSQLALPTGTPAFRLEPSNLREPPPRPDGTLPRRRRRTRLSGQASGGGAESLSES